MDNASIGMVRRRMSLIWFGEVHLNLDSTRKRLSYTMYSICREGFEGYDQTSAQPYLIPALS